ncbi:hypothetical protein ACSSQ8_002986 [Cronobacter sakazakii]|nr:hypothetical protein [Cronobacter sakazakii]ELU8380759.1 hypothetical protein [Cronobacter sakazakii]ELU8384838.1 hypothetical protein [Cronobacter sakazakii]ELU8424784.1 hypothetical protein [Cronobacter sakazakii]ELU8460839.1 hypothetical protein [Cronobacter sakazakii]
MMRKGIIRQGDKLTSGGEVITATSTFKVNGKWYAQSVFGSDPAEDLKSTWVLELPARRKKVLEQQQESFDTAMQVIQ